MFGIRAADGMSPSPGDLPNIRNETFPVRRDESGDKANLRDRLSVQPPTDEENAGNRSNTMPMVTDTNLGGISLARQLLISTTIGLLGW